MDLSQGRSLVVALNDMWFIPARFGAATRAPTDLRRAMIYIVACVDKKIMNFQSFCGQSSYIGLGLKVDYVGLS